MEKFGSGIKIPDSQHFILAITRHLDIVSAENYLQSKTQRASENALTVDASYSEGGSLAFDLDK
jgi:hypothetical protein